MDVWQPSARPTQYGCRLPKRSGEGTLGSGGSESGRVLLVREWGGNAGSTPVRRLKLPRTLMALYLEQ
jgi:hypothetical protein